ncbi:hypothetical protein GO495_22135 [Chitinophaga oryziterrae]|uniref:EF-hand domain-containing protein n=1 Tax=Chitinophaga oryziterrae TaxID=1031224 RepID=A0A6N8JEC3_9BACT|nr:hypothetical protein [Chitinophaga oryziterrae]MVT43314.1 hypothetical protein [Chitinophaga oryziterrae]
MFEQFMQLVQQYSQHSVVNNPDVPNEHNEGVMKEAGSAIMSVLGGEPERAGEILDNPDHPAVQQIQGNFVTNIMQKFGISESAAAGIATTLIPTVMASLRNGGDGSGFNIQEILQSVGGGNLGNIGAKLGLDKDGDGDVDLNDVTRIFKF